MKYNHQAAPSLFPHVFQSFVWMKQMHGITIILPSVAQLAKICHSSKDLSMAVLGPNGE